MPSRTFINAVVTYCSLAESPLEDRQLIHPCLQIQYADELMSPLIYVQYPGEFSQFLLVEADEYDTAFFDKRSKFVHYNPKTLIINNISFDHADIFDDLHAIQRQFHHMIRTIPSTGRILSFVDEQSVKETLNMGCWSEQQFIGKDKEWFAERITNDCSEFAVFHHGQKVAEVKWNIVGQHNMHNALMAIAAAYHAGVKIEDACHALGSFINAKRRLEVKGEVNGITVYDDFAHHPEAIHKRHYGL